MSKLIELIWPWAKIRRLEWEAQRYRETIQFLRAERDALEEQLWARMSR